MFVKDRSIYSMLLASAGCILSIGCGLQKVPATQGPPMITGVRLLAAPAIIRSEAPFQYHLLADYSNGTSELLSAGVAWSTDPTIATVSQSGIVSCNNAGSTVLAGTFSGMTVRVSFTCILHSIITKPGFVESALTFDGPFSSWKNIQTVFGAKGDGVTDDTAALQAALDSLKTHPAVLWVPHGTYVLTRPLTVTGLTNITILGEDPLRTTIAWAGPKGSTMFTLSGCAGFNVGRLTWDGSGIAAVALEVTWDDVSNYYPTRNFIHDSKIINVATGIHTGYAGETTVERVHFDHNTVAGLSLGDWDALDWNVIDCLFTDNAIGVTNWYGAGAFNVSNSVFERSTSSDMKMGNTGQISIRSNISIDSNAFFLTGETGAPASVIIQGNTIYHSSSTPIETGTPGSLMILDNQFLDLDSNLNILYSFCNSPTNFISAGNTYSVPKPFSGNIGQYTTVDESVQSSAGVAIPPSVPEEIYIPPLSHRQVFDVTDGASTSDIQAAIDAAAAVAGIVHLSQGAYNVTQSLRLPQDSNVGILGDGALSVLQVASTFQGPVIDSYAKSLQIQDLWINSYSLSSTDISLHLPDVPATRVFCDECTINNQTTGVEVDGIDDATIESKATTLSTGNWAQSVHGGSARQKGIVTLGRVGEFMTSSSAYQVDNGGHFLLEDGWHDGGQGPTQFVLTGSGSVTQEGGTVCSSANPAMTVDDFSGDLSLLGVITTSYVNVPAGSPLTLFIGGVVDTGGEQPYQSSEPSANISELSSSLAPPNVIVSPLPNSPVTPISVEHMMSSARNEVLSFREPTVFDSYRATMTRVLLDGGGVGIRVQDNVVGRSAGTYRITPTGGASISTCGPGKVAMSGIWTLQDGGDGYVGLMTTGGLLSESSSQLVDGDGVMMDTMMASARDRWRLEQYGDGSQMIVNRATGNLLTTDSAGCAYAAPANGSVSQHWLVDGTN